MPRIDTTIDDAVNKMLGEVELEETKVSPLVKKLNRNSLSVDDCLSVLGSIVHNGDSDAIKLRAVESGLKLNGVLVEQPKQMPSFNIIINDPNSSISVNPILIPRSGI